MNTQIPHNSKELDLSLAGDFLDWVIENLKDLDSKPSNPVTVTQKVDLNLEELQHLLCYEAENHNFSNPFLESFPTIIPPTSPLTYSQLKSSTPDMKNCNNSPGVSKPSPSNKSSRKEKAGNRKISKPSKRVLIEQNQDQMLASKVKKQRLWSSGPLQISLKRVDQVPKKEIPLTEIEGIDGSIITSSTPSLSVSASAFASSSSSSSSSSSQSTAAAAFAYAPPQPSVIKNTQMKTPEKSLATVSPAAPPRTQLTTDPSTGEPLLASKKLRYLISPPSVEFSADIKDKDPKASKIIKSRLAARDFRKRQKEMVTRLVERSEKLANENVRLKIMLTKLEGSRKIQV